MQTKIKHNTHTKLKLRWVNFERRWIRIKYWLCIMWDPFLIYLPPADISEYDSADIDERVNYYNKLESTFSVQNPMPFWQQKFFQEKPSKNKGNFNRSSFYVCDLFHLLARMRNGDNMKFDYFLGDISHTPPQPTIVKSRPIDGDNRNSVILKINYLRHFRLVNDPLPYEKKKDMAVWRGAIKTNPRRQLLIDRYQNHPLCDVAGSKKRGANQLPERKAYMGISAQLQYKFIISIEGYDVGSNLKWIMSSNSLCMTHKLKHETWFMEGRLIAGVHYVEFADDFSDLGEKIEYYLAHPDEARAIIANANQYVAQFMDKRREDYIGRRVLQKYFALSGQQQ